MKKQYELHDEMIEPQTNIQISNWEKSQRMLKPCCLHLRTEMISHAHILIKKLSCKFSFHICIQKMLTFLSCSTYEIINENLEFKKHIYKTAKHCVAQIDMSTCQFQLNR